MTCTAADRRSRCTAGAVVSHTAHPPQAFRTHPFPADILELGARSYVRYLRPLVGRLLFPERLREHGDGVLEGGDRCISRRALTVVHDEDALGDGRSREG